ENIVGHADFPDFTQFFLRPNLSCRIMRITVNVDFYIILLAQCFKMVEIERVAIFIFYEWTVYNFPLIALQLANEGIVAWCRKDYPITFFGMLSDDFPDCKEHRWCIRNFLFLEFNTETGFPPMLYRPVKSRILPYRIAEDTVVYPLFHRIGNRLCNFNIHVCNPERFQRSEERRVGKECD